MSANIDLHITDETVTVESRIHPMTDQPDFATFTIGSGNTMVRLYVRKLEDLEKIAFELNALIREARDERGWGLENMTTVAEVDAYNKRVAGL
ncbi:MAG TPA: hypothetical protein VIY48_12785 [Candidatus Paceibacterota bacterium]